MTACKDIQKLLPVSPVDVSPEEYRRITEHLAACPVCHRVQQDLGALERAAAEIEVPDPGSGYWDNFALRVRQRVGAKPAKEPAWWVRWFVLRPVVSWPATTAALILVIVVLRALWPGSPRQVVQQLVTPASKPAVSSTSPVEKADEKEVAASPGESQSSKAQQPVKQSRQEEPVKLAEETPRTRSTAQPVGKAPEFKPDAIPSEEQQLASAKRGLRPGDSGPPGRTTVVLRGDTIGAEINKGVPEGRELELAERPNAPFPTGDTATASQAQRELGASIGEGYRGVAPQTPALNRGEFTAQDREFFTGRIKKLSEQLGKEKGAAQRATCRALVDMYYQLAMNWRSPADIDGAIAFMAKARKILPEEDHPDLDTKTAALKSLSGR